jgi:hypothetical protein
MSYVFLIIGLAEFVVGVAWGLMRLRAKRRAPESADPEPEVAESPSPLPETFDWPAFERGLEARLAAQREHPAGDGPG